MLPASKDESAPVPEMTAAAPAPSDLVVCARYDACLPVCMMFTLPRKESRDWWCSPTVLSRSRSPSWSLGTTLDVTAIGSETDLDVCVCSGFDDVTRSPPFDDLGSVQDREKNFWPEKLSSWFGVVCRVSRVALCLVQHAALRVRILSVMRRRSTVRGLSARWLLFAGLGIVLGLACGDSCGSVCGGG